MTGLALLLAASAMGVDYGWRPHEEGGVEYIIQIEPEVFASLQAGGDIVSEIHPDAGDVRRFRIRVGRGSLPREEAKAAATDDGPLPPAPPGDLTSSDATPSTTSASTASGRSSPPLNHLAQGSGYGSPFGGYNGGYTRAGSTSSPATTTSGTSGTSTAASGSYGGARTSSDYSGSSRNGYTEYTGATGTAATSNPANSNTSTNAGAVSSGTTTTRGDEAWNRGDVRTASNQQTVTSSSSNNNAAATATANSGQYTSQPATSQTTPNQQPALTTATGVSGTRGQTPPVYNTNSAGTYRGTRDYSTTIGASDGTSSTQGQTGSLTPISGYENYRTGAATNTASSTQGAADQSRWTAAPASRQQDQGIAPPPAYPQGVAYPQGGANPQGVANESSTGYAATAANGNYGNAAYNNSYNNQYPAGAAPPLLAPPAAPQGNYGYVPAGYPPYQPGQPGPGYGYGQAPGYYAMPSISPPVLTASATNATESSSRSRSQRDEEEEEDYRERRPATTLAAAAPAAPAAQANVVTSEPWLAFTITIVLLFASIGGNIYLLWISQDFYWRYKELANDLRASVAS